MPKPTEHKVTIDDVLHLLSSNGGVTSQEIGEECWPDKIGCGPARGGPSAVAVSATFLLSKMEHAGLVESRLPRYGPRLWWITRPGRERLRRRD